MSRFDFNGSPLEVLERLRLACDPLKFAHTMRCREVLARWLDAGDGREHKSTRVREGELRAWRHELYEGGELVASETRLDHDDSLAHALSQVGAS